MSKDTIICRCEEVSESEIRQAVREGARTIAGVKARTRAGMGLCQRRTCQRLIARIIAEEAGLPLGEILPNTSRPPCRPLTLGTMAGEQE